MRIEHKPGMLLLAALIGTLLLIILAANLIAPGLDSPPTMRIDPAAARRFTTGKIDTIDLTGEGLPLDLRASLNRDVDNRSAIVGWFDLPGDARRFVIDNGRGYLATGFGGLHIIDIDNPRNLRVIGSEASNGLAWDLAVRNQHVFLTASGLQVIDISQPESPHTVATLPAPDTDLLDLAIAGDTLYAGSSKGLHIYDISAPESPRHIKTIPFAGGPWALAVRNNLLFLSFHDGKRETFGVFDISRPHTPRQLAAMHMPSRVWGISLHDHYAYLPTGRAGMLIVDIARPASPSLREVVKEGLYADFVTFDGNRAYCASRRGDFNIFNVEDPTRFERIGEVSLPAQTRPIVIHRGIAFVANGHAGLLSIDVGNPRPFEHALVLKEPDEVAATLSDGEWIYLAGKNKGLYVGRRNRKEHTIDILAELPVTLGLNALARIGTTLCALAPNAKKALFIDISDPRSPQLAGAMTGNIRFKAITENGRLFILADEDGKIHLVDARQPSSPQIIASISVPDASKLLVDGDRLFAAGGGEDLLTIVDLSKPESPTILSRFSLPWPMRDTVGAFDLAMADDWLVVAAGKPGLLVFDVSQAANPKMIKGIDLGAHTGVLAYANERLYAATTAGELWVLKKGKDGFIRTAATGAMGKSVSLQIHGDEALLANGNKGLAVIPLPREVEVRVETPQRHLRLQLPDRLPPGDYRLELITGNRFFTYVPISIADPEQGKANQKL